MHIKRIIIKGFKALDNLDLSLGERFNVIVGDNETGKSTLLEAINLVLSCQMDGRNIQYELNPHIFNHSMVQRYFAAMKEGKHPSPPYTLIEAYLDDGEGNDLAKLRGTNNSEHEDCPGLYLRVELNEDFADEFTEYICAPESPSIVPTEYYRVAWRSFADNPMRNRSQVFLKKIEKIA